MIFNFGLWILHSSPIRGITYFLYFCVNHITVRAFMWKNFIRGPLFLLMALSGCMTTRQLPKADLSGQGWTVQQGQAVWHTPRQNVFAPPHAGLRPAPPHPEIAGDLIVATRTDGSAFVQFSKTPFTLATAQMSPTGWQIEFPPQNRHYARPGKPPAQIVWFQLAEALMGKPVAKNWSWHGSAAKWRLENRSSGESLEGYLTQ